MTYPNVNKTDDFIYIPGNMYTNSGKVDKRT